MRRAWERALARWVDAGLIEPGLEARIRAFEQQHAAGSAVVQPMVKMALGLGGVLIGAGVLLFVSANWGALSPFSRFGLVLLLVGGFHLAAIAVAPRFPALTPVLHALGTVSLGAGIFLTGQIFNLDEHWPGGVMLWAMGAAVAFALVRDQDQAALTAILVPAWLISEGIEAGGPGRAEGVGLFLLAVAYFTVPIPRQSSSLWRPLRMIGGVALIPAGIFLVVSFMIAAAPQAWRGEQPPVPWPVTAIEWAVALAVPFAVSLVSRGLQSWKWAAAAAWTLLLLAFQVTFEQHLPVYLWAAVACVGLAWWGFSERRPERVNIAAAAFALTVLFFYFDSIMDKIGRSASLLGLGVLFLAGGYALERARRKMIARLEEVRA